MNLLRFAVVFLFIGTTSIFGQEISSQNPLQELKDQVTKILFDAGLPFTEEQESELALFIEEQKQASEDLFGEIFDFRGGPPQGQDRERALAGIQWMQDAFSRKLADFLTPQQRAAWEDYSALQPTGETGGSGSGSSAGSATSVRSEQVQLIRINNNDFTAENGGGNGFGGGGGGGDRTEIIQRGGTGEFHGNFSTNFQDEKLNARNPFAANKPPYHERNISGNFSGPLIRNFLTINIGGNDNRQENVGTVKAETLNGPFSLGITRPNVNRNTNWRGLFQLSDSTSLNASFRHGMNRSENQGIGDLNLPESGRNTSGVDKDFNLKQVSVLSTRSVYETRFTYRTSHDENKPITETVGINVLGAFRGGGAQDNTESDSKNIEFGNMLYYAGESYTLRTGFDAWHNRPRSESRNNFFGEFTFSDLDSYRAGQPLKYRVTVGEPVLAITQTQLALFAQNDLKLTNRFTLMLGVRYETQTNLDDKNNFDPRLGFAYALSNSTVMRGGVGIFHQRLDTGTVSNVLRLDGQRQYELVVDNPSWPDPFQAGEVRTVPPSSRRVRAEDLVAPYNINSSVSVERSLPNNLFVTVSASYNRGVKLLRSRNLNAPLPGTGEKPFPNEGNIYQLESTANNTFKNFRVSMRQRFSIFNLSASYTLASGYDESNGAFNLPSDNYNLRSDWGRAGFVQKHQFNTSVNSRLPLDVYLTTNIQANSGQPYNITTGRDDNGDSQTNDRPAGVERNSGDSPRFFNVSFNFNKAFRLSGGNSGPQVSFFTNLNNALNMTNFGNPIGVMTSRSFGKPTNARNAREIEVGMRFQF